MTDKTNENHEYENENCQCHIDECSCDTEQKPQTDEIDWQDQALRALAEIQNIKHRSQIEIQRNSTLLLKDFAKDIISVLDSYDYAFKAIEKLPQTEELKATVQGFKAIYDSFLNILKKHNITKIPTTGHPFNPNIHNAVIFDKGKNGEILETAENGYQMGDEILRPAAVVVGKE